MNDYVITCCSTADLSKEYFLNRDIKVVYFHFELDGTNYLDDCGESIPPELLFEKMNNGADTKTSQVSVGEYIDFWTEFLDAGMDILHISLSSGLSGSYNSAVVAKNFLSDKYPDRKVYVVDSLGASSGYGLIMDTLADMRDDGKGVDELHDWIEENKLRMHHWFYSTDLSFYIRGGRISKTAGMVGQLLSICPLLNMDHNGHLMPREKVRGKTKIMKRALDMMEMHADGGRAYSGKCFMCHSMCIDEAAELAGMIQDRFPDLNGQVCIYPIGATIGSHTGPGTISIFFWGDIRND
ncbi:MAG: DegV family protein [Lachnospiraceae bacterium]|nr:DegV family protein [Lachnospiraceae bacterium]